MLGSYIRNKYFVAAEENCAWFGLGLDDPRAMVAVEGDLSPITAGFGLKHLEHIYGHVQGLGQAFGETQGKEPGPSAASARKRAPGGPGMG